MSPLPRTLVPLAASLALGFVATPAMAQGAARTRLVSSRSAPPSRDADAPSRDTADTDSAAADPVETDAPEVDAPEVDAPEVDAPEVDAPEVDAPETDPVETDPVETGASESLPAPAEALSVPDALPAPTPSPRTARVRFASDRPGQTIFEVDDGEAWMRLGGIPLDAYEPVCEAPCETSFRAGPVMLAVGGRGRPRGHQTFELDGEHSIRVVSIDHSGTRATGWVLLLSGLALSGALLGASLASQEYSVEFGIASSAVLFDSMMSGMILAALEDSTSLRFD